MKIIIRDRETGRLITSDETAERARWKNAQIRFGTDWAYFDPRKSTSLNAMDFDLKHDEHVQALLNGLAQNEYPQLEKLEFTGENAVLNGTAFARMLCTNTSLVSLTLCALDDPVPVLRAVADRNTTLEELRMILIPIETLHGLQQPTDQFKFRIVAAVTRLYMRNCTLNDLLFRKSFDGTFFKDAVSSVGGFYGNRFEVRTPSRNDYDSPRTIVFSTEDVKEHVKACRRIHAEAVIKARFALIAAHKIREDVMHLPVDPAAPPVAMKEGTLLYHYVRYALGTTAPVSLEMSTTAWRWYESLERLGLV